MSTCLVIDLNDERNTNKEIIRRVEQILRELDIHPQNLSDYLHDAELADRELLIDFSKSILDEYDIDHDFYYDNEDDWDDQDEYEKECGYHGNPNGWVWEETNDDEEVTFTVNHRDFQILDATKYIEGKGYKYRGIPENYSGFMQCKNCVHFKKPQFVLGKWWHGDCSKLSWGEELAVAEDYICIDHELKEKE